MYVGRTGTDECDTIDRTDECDTIDRDVNIDVVIIKKKS